MTVSSYEVFEELDNAVDVVRYLMKSGIDCSITCYADQLLQVTAAIPASEFNEILNLIKIGDAQCA